ncbi:MAG: hypothetical protein ACLQM8_09855 [Limisphaerales bacterium]
MKSTKLFRSIMVPCLLASSVNAETILGPTSETNRVLLSTNEAVLIETVLPAGWNGVDCGFIASNVTYSLNIDQVLNGPYALSGPGELVLSNECAVHLIRLLNTPIQTVLLPGGSNSTSPVSINVPGGKSVQLFHQFSADDPVAATITRGMQSFSSYFYPGQSLQGPLTLTLDPSDSLGYWYHPSSTNSGPASIPPIAFISYWFVEDVFQNPSMVLSSQFGVPGLAVQQSPDLNSWQSVGTLGVTISSNSFYRLKILR